LFALPSEHKSRTLSTFTPPWEPMTVKDVAVWGPPCYALAVLFAIHIYAKGSHLCIVILLDLLVLLLLAAVGWHSLWGSALLTGLVACVMFYQHRRICDEENNKTLAMARQMQVPLMSEEEEALQTRSKKIFQVLAVLGAASCTICASEALAVHHI
ncbi:unnamed protein product, partial [Durusdinium trenchii]